VARWRVFSNALVALVAKRQLRQRIASASAVCRTAQRDGAKGAAPRYAQQAGVKREPERTQWL